MMENFEPKAAPKAEIETEENLSVDAKGNMRSMRTMPDGTVASLSNEEYADEVSAYNENNSRKPLG